MRAVEDDHVDRLQVEVQRCMEPSSTNCPKASGTCRKGNLQAHFAILLSLPLLVLKAQAPPNLPEGEAKAPFPPPFGGIRGGPGLRNAGGYSERAHLFPFRTEKLSLSALMVLPERVGE